MVLMSLCCGIEKTSVDNTRLRDRVRVYRQHIKQPKHQNIKVEEHMQIYEKVFFKIFQFLQMEWNDPNLRRVYEKKF